MPADIINKILTGKLANEVGRDELDQRPFVAPLPPPTCLCI